MKIGVVTPAFNVAATIGDTIRSVIAQSHTDWAMVVVDDGSTDGTGDMVLGFSDPRLTLLTQANAGVSAARNRGATALDCDAMLFLDGDDWLAPHALAALASTLSKTPDAVAAVGAYERGGRVFAPISFASKSGDLLERLLVRNLFANGGHILIRRSAVGDFRSDLRFGEDWEYWVRLALSGVFVATSGPSPLLFVRERPSGAYLRMATDPASFGPCLDAIHDMPALAMRFPTERLAALRRLAAAEMQWTVGRELLRHRRHGAGQAWLRKSVAAAPSARRWLLLAAAHALPMLPPNWRGALRPYPP